MKQIYLISFILLYTITCYSQAKHFTNKEFFNNTNLTKAECVDTISYVHYWWENLPIEIKFNRIEWDSGLNTININGKVSDYYSADPVKTVWIYIGSVATNDTVSRIIPTSYTKVDSLGIFEISSAVKRNDKMIFLPYFPGCQVYHTYVFSLEFLFEE